jgi:hypothetical protein
VNGQGAENASCNLWWETKTKIYWPISWLKTEFAGKHDNGTHQKLPKIINKKIFSNLRRRRLCQNSKRKEIGESSLDSYSDPKKMAKRYEKMKKHKNIY